MILPILLMAQISAAGDGPQLPMEGFAPLSGYMTCLFQPLERNEIPPAVADREAMVATIMSGCRPARATAFEQADAVLTAHSAYSDRSARAANIEGFLSHWERLLRFIVVDHEQFVEADRRREECLDRGEPEC